MKELCSMSFFVFLLLVLQSCLESQKPELAGEPSYVGSEKCAGCHAKENAAYSKSHHFHALDSANAKNVKGDFNDSKFVYFGDTSFFFTKNNSFYVLTTDSSGTKRTFKIWNCIGFYPLQQYLVAFEDGRIQTLPFCWDSRLKQEGGQRWFHINDKEKILAGDELFWMGINSNWNTMCADCHTTGFYRNFDEERNRFTSTWKESGVSCESCHGPASQHMQWTETGDSSVHLKGFAINLRTPPGNWIMNESRGVALPEKINKNDQLIEMCARCHGRATRLTDVYHHGQSFLQSHLPSVLDTTNYYIDGQIKNEVYEYGSFLQSKMYAAGVTCMHCHDTHSMNLKAEGNTLCASCHLPSKFDTQAHTHHEVGSTGAACVNCHMTETNYMVIDGRRDHSFRIPRPDLSTELGTPNACNKCHTHESTKWAASKFMEWYGDKLSKQSTYGQHLFNISKKNSEGRHSLTELLKGAYPDVVQSTAIGHTTEFLDPSHRALVQEKSESRDPLVRLQALQALTVLDDQEQLTILRKGINDPVLAVRMEAIKNMAPHSRQLAEADRSTFEKGLNEYLALETKLSDRPEGYLNRGIILASVQRNSEAEAVYKLGLSRHPVFIGFYANLADLYRLMNREEISKRYLETGLFIQPTNAALHFAFGLWHIRNKDRKNGLSELKRATTLAPANGYYAYAYALGLKEQGQTKKAIIHLEDFMHQHGNDLMVLQAISALYRDEGNDVKARKYAELQKRVFGY